MLTVILTVILIMPAGHDDITQSHPMASLLECFDAALIIAVGRQQLDEIVRVGPAL